MSIPSSYSHNIVPKVLFLKTSEVCAAPVLSVMWSSLKCVQSRTPLLKTFTLSVQTGVYCQYLLSNGSDFLHTSPQPVWIYSGLNSHGASVCCLNCGEFKCAIFLLYQKISIPLESSTVLVPPFFVSPFQQWSLNLVKRGCDMFRSDHSTICYSLCLENV